MTASEGWENVQAVVTADGKLDFYDIQGHWVDGYELVDRETAIEYWHKEQLGRAPWWRKK